MAVVGKRNEIHFSVKGQVVIPWRLRKAFAIEEGTRATVEATSEGILIKPITHKFIRSLRGSLKGKGILKATMEERAAPE